MEVWSAAGLLLVILSAARAAEWHTSSEQICIERCRTKGRDYTWCPTVDGISVKWIYEDGDRPDYEEPEDKFPWDYCTPARDLGPQEEPGREEEEYVTLPAPIDNTGSGGGGGGFNSGFNPGPVMSSFPGVPCSGACTFQGNGYQCPVEKRGMFYCSSYKPLARRQLSARNKLWCMGGCNKNENDTNYMCHTLYGKDNCSPQGNKSTSGKLCYSQCQINFQHPNRHYQCYVDKSQTRQEDCGYFHVDSSKTKGIELMSDHKVCASPCLEEEGRELCSYVEWNWNSAMRGANLQLKVGECGPGSSSGTDWVLIGIIIGVVVGGIILIAVVAIVVISRAKATSKAEEGGPQTNMGMRALR